MSEEYGKSINWVRSKINAAKALKKEVAPDGHAFVADATFFEKAYGYLIYRIPELKKNVYFASIMYESIAEYQRGRTKVQKLGFTIRAITLDGRPGVRNLFSDIPVQMCHFHRKYPKIKIPNTTNLLNGSFSWLKQKVGIHMGMTKINRAKIIEYILNN